MKNDLFREWENEEKAAFCGWDFSYLEDRWEEEKLPWDYKEIIGKYLTNTNTLLDMGTGGGEFLLLLKHPYELTSATEGYLPNFELCKKKLGGHGINVKYAVGESALPFDDSIFDVVINRHEAYHTEEVYRVLKPGGVFVTQQVGARNSEKLSRKLIGSKRKIDAEWDLKYAVKSLEDTGFEILRRDEYFPYLKFFDVGAVVFFAKVIEWEFPGFRVQKCCDELMKLNEDIELVGFVESTEHRFLIAARKRT